MNQITEFFSSRGFMPHIHCYLGKPSLVWTMVITDLLIGLAYVSISLILWALVRKIKIQFSAVVLCFGVFIGACGATHFMEIYTLWIPDYWSSAFVKAITAIASVGTGLYLFNLRGPITAMAEAAKLSESRKSELESLTRNLEQRITERTRDLQRALQVRDDFFSVASHELRTPLTSLKLKTQMAVRGISKEQSPQFVREMHEQVERLGRLVEDMLDIARFRGGTLPMSFTEIDLATLLRRTLKQFAGILDAAGNRLAVHIPESLMAEVDQMRIEQVINNLIINVTKYAPGTNVTVNLSRSGTDAKLVVSDEGPGIPETDQARVFRKFERVSPREHSGGLGVGLYLSRAIVEAHGGLLLLESKEGSGSTFIITLPLQQAPRGTEESLQLGEA